jgi:hypothetical protein
MSAQQLVRLKMKILLTAISLLLISTIATAVCLKGHPSIAEEYADSRNVFIGKVAAIKAVPESGNYYDGHNYTVQVQEVFKGNPAKPIVIFSENSSGRYPMVVGSTYLIFVYYELDHYQINSCGNTGVLPDKEDAVLAVRRLGKAQRNPI